ncbi:Ankyrin repeat-containing domain [Phytophthora cactorum]|nr:Ankyrin repeat-containing domain [Phytophthora cactorum]
MATEKGSLPILEFLLANDSSEDNKVQWGAASVQQALRHDHLDVVHWLYKNTSQTETTEEQHEWTIKAAMDADDIEFCQSLMPKGACILDYTEYCATPQMIEWKLDSEYFKRGEYGAVVAIRDLAARDQLDLMNRIASEHNPPPEDSGWPQVWGDALAEACMAARLSTVQWLLEHPTGRQVIEILRGARSLRADKTLSKLLSYPAELGNVEMMQYLYDQGAVDRLGNTLLDAIRANQVESVKWLLQHFPDSERILDYAVMHEAARRGHVDMLQYFQSLGPSGVSGFFLAQRQHREKTNLAKAKPLTRLECLWGIPIASRGRHFAGLADRILGNIAQQIAGQLGGAVHVNVVRGQQGAGQAEPDGVLGMMNNFVVFARGNNDDANNDDESSSEDDDE